MKFKWLIKDNNLLPHLLAIFSACLAILLLALGFLRPWYAVPSILDTEIVGQDASITIFFKVSVALILFVTLLLSLVARRKIFILLCGIMISFLIILYYPAFLSQRDHERMGDAAWLQQQHDSMTWLGGDIYRAHSERSIGWGAGVNAQDPPDRLALYKPPRFEVDFQSLNDWISWLGYGPGFTQFVGKGWFMSLGSIVLIAVFLLGVAWRDSISKARVLIRHIFLFGLIGGGLTFSIAATPVIVCGYFLQTSKVYLSEGHFSKSLKNLRHAAIYLPTLYIDTGFIRQIGYLEHRLKLDSEGAKLLYTINYLEQEGYLQRAREVLPVLAQKNDQIPSYYWREILRQHLRVAINEINSNRISEAVMRLKKLEKESPMSPQVLFHQQFLALQMGNVVESRRLHARLVELYRLFKSKNKRGVLAASYLMLAQVELEAGNLVESMEARRKSKGL